MWPCFAAAGIEQPVAFKQNNNKTKGIIFFISPASLKGYGALPLRNTQKAIYQISYCLSDYYNNNHKSTRE